MGGAREAPAPRDSLNFRRASLLSRNEYESGTFTIVFHATSSFTNVSVIYGANFPFNINQTPFFFPSDKCELKAGSDEKNTAQPRPGSNSGLPIAGRTL